MQNLPWKCLNFAMGKVSCIYHPAGERKSLAFLSVQTVLFFLLSRYHLASPRQEKLILAHKQFSLSDPAEISQQHQGRCHGQIHASAISALTCEHFNLFTELFVEIFFKNIISYFTIGKITNDFFCFTIMFTSPTVFTKYLSACWLSFNSFELLKIFVTGH